MNELKRYFFTIISIMIVGLLPLQAQNIKNYNVYTDSLVINSNQYINGNIYQKDFLLYIDLLKTTHPEFAPGRFSSINIDSISKEGYKWVAKCNLTDNLKVYLQSIASLINDGHTGVMPNLDKNYIYPFSLFFDENGTYLQLIDKNYESYLGKKIIKINHQPIEKIVESFRSQISSDNATSFYDKVKVYMQFYDPWRYIPYCMKDSSLIISFKDTNDIILKPMSSKTINYVSLQTKDAKDLITIENKKPFSYSILPEESICYLQFNKCTDNSDIRYQLNARNTKITEEMERELSQVPRFDTLVASMFDKMGEENINTLVVDVRNNGGGNSRLCDVLLSYLKPYDEMKSLSSQIRISNLWEEQFPIMAKEYKDIFEKENKELEKGRLYGDNEFNFENNDSSFFNNMEDYFQLNKDKNKIYRGNVVFIQSPKTFSSAGLLIMLAVDNNIGKVIGSKSSYKPCNYGDLLTWELPNTNIQGFISHKIFYRPDTTKCNETSIVPEINIQTTIEDMLNGNDRCWDWVLEKYSK